MARLFKQTYSRRLRDGTMERTKGKVWVAEYRGSDGVIHRRSTRTADKSAAAQLAAEWERTDARNAAFGIDPRQAAQSQRPLAEHVDDWRAAVLDKDATTTHANLSKNRVQTILDAIKATRWTDLDANKVAGYLADRRKAGLSIQSSNHYIRRIKQFASWMVKCGRALSSPLGILSMQNARTDRRHDRRALASEELAWLIHSTRRGQNRNGLSGSERAAIYTLAAETGLRAAEIASLTAGSFRLDDDAPAVTVLAGYSKRRRDDTIPLRAETVAELRGVLAHRLPGARAFPIADLSKLSRTIRADLSDARAAWVDAADTPAERTGRERSFTLAYRDDSGRVADFHSLRHTFISNLARGGVHPKVAQTLARHSTITLTMDRYSHTVVEDLRDALTALPDVRTDSDTAIAAAGPYCGRGGVWRGIYVERNHPGQTSAVQCSMRNNRERGVLCGVPTGNRPRFGRADRVICGHRTGDRQPSPRCTLQPSRNGWN